MKNRRDLEAKEAAEAAEAESMIEKIRAAYGEKGLEIILGNIPPKPHIFTVEQLDDDQIIDIVINAPAYKRDSKINIHSISEKRGQTSLF